MEKHRSTRDRKRRLPRPTRGRIAVFLSVLAASGLLTLFGLAEFVGQLSTATSVKAGMIAIVLQSGLVVLGPVILWAYFNLIPKGLTASITRRLRGALLGAARAQQT